MIMTPSKTLKALICVITVAVITCAACTKDEARRPVPVGIRLWVDSAWADTIDI